MGESGITYSTKFIDREPVIDTDLPLRGWPWQVERFETAFSHLVGYTTLPPGRIMLAGIMHTAATKPIRDWGKELLNVSLVNLDRWARIGGLEEDWLPAGGKKGNIAASAGNMFGHGRVVEDNFKARAVCSYFLYRLMCQKKSTAADPEASKEAEWRLPCNERLRKGVEGWILAYPEEYALWQGFVQIPKEYEIYFVKSKMVGPYHHTMLDVPELGWVGVKSLCDPDDDAIVADAYEEAEGRDLFGMRQAELASEGLETQIQKDEKAAAFHRERLEDIERKIALRQARAEEERKKVLAANCASQVATMIAISFSCEKNLESATYIENGGQIVAWVAKSLGFNCIPIPEHANLGAAAYQVRAANVRRGGEAGEEQVPEPVINDNQVASAPVKNLCSSTLMIARDSAKPSASSAKPPAHDNETSTSNDKKNKRKSDKPDGKKLDGLTHDNIPRPGSKPKACKDKPDGKKLDGLTHENIPRASNKPKACEKIAESTLKKQHKVKRKSTNQMEELFGRFDEIRPSKVSKSSSCPKITSTSTASKLDEKVASKKVKSRGENAAVPVSPLKLVPQGEWKKPPTPGRFLEEESVGQTQAKEPDLLALAVDSILDRDEVVASGELEGDRQGNSSIFSDDDSL